MKKGKKINVTSRTRGKPRLFVTPTTGRGQVGRQKREWPTNGAEHLSPAHESSAISRPATYLPQHVLRKHERFFESVFFLCCARGKASDVVRIKINKYIRLRAKLIVIRIRRRLQALHLAYVQRERPWRDLRTAPACPHCRSAISPVFRKKTLVVPVHMT